MLLVLTSLSKTFLLLALDNGTGSIGGNINFCWMSWEFPMMQNYVDGLQFTIFFSR
jgi:hypothetical protein